MNDDEKAFMTTRERILRLLLETDKPMDIEGIGYALGLPRSSFSRISSDLEHIARSLKRRSEYKMVILPPRCVDCGYVFPSKWRFRRPSRCPRCGSYRIKGPWFRIIAKRKG